MKIKFLRRNTKEYSRLGKKRKKLQKWRAPKGRDNKMRLRRKSYPRTVEIGYKQDKKTRGKVEGKEIIIVQNLDDLKKNVEGKEIIVAKVGKKKKIEIGRLAKEKNLKIKNLDLEDLLKNKREDLKEKKK